mmetsp:Transcript_25333/g.73134  ORF Transcript_25333/g.73134 Transcript_25333/m.73134 type:complete len:258 (+) Transcript_25333:330-1103(+)
MRATGACATSIVGTHGPTTAVTSARNTINPYSVKGNRNTNGSSEKRLNCTVSVMATTPPSTVPRRMDDSVRDSDSYTPTRTTCHFESPHALRTPISHIFSRTLALEDVHNRKKAKTKAMIAHTAKNTCSRSAAVCVVSVSVLTSMMACVSSIIDRMVFVMKSLSSMVAFGTNLTYKDALPSPLCVAARTFATGLPMLAPSCCPPGPPSGSVSSLSPPMLTGTSGDGGGGPAVGRGASVSVLFWLPASDDPSLTEKPA